MWPCSRVALDWGDIFGLGGLLKVAVDPLLTSTIIIFTLSPVTPSTPSRSLPNGPDSLSINSHFP